MREAIQPRVSRRRASRSVAVLRHQGQARRKPRAARASRKPEARVSCQLSAGSAITRIRTVYSCVAMRRRPRVRRRLFGDRREKIGHRLQDRLVAGLGAVPPREPMRVVVADVRRPERRARPAPSAADRCRSSAPPASAACQPCGLPKMRTSVGGSARPTAAAAAAWSTRATTAAPRFVTAAASRSIVSFGSWRLDADDQSFRRHENPPAAQASQAKASVNAAVDQRAVRAATPSTGSLRAGGEPARRHGRAPCRRRARAAGRTWRCATAAGRPARR